MRTFTRQPDRDRPPDSRTASGDKCKFAGVTLEKLGHARRFRYFPRSVCTIDTNPARTLPPSLPSATNV